MSSYKHWLMKGIRNCPDMHACDCAAAAEGGVGVLAEGEDDGDGGDPDDGVGLEAGVVDDGDGGDKVGAISAGPGEVAGDEDDGALVSPDDTDGEPPARDGVVGDIPGDPAGGCVAADGGVTFQPPRVYRCVIGVQRGRTVETMQHACSVHIQYRCDEA